MNHAGGSPQSSTTVLPSILSLYLLKDPPSPPSALPMILRNIDERKPFLSISSNSQVLHKWNTRVSSLIQSKSAESRYWGVCLANATISNGGEGVGHAVVWVKLLLAILNVHPHDFMLISATRGKCSLGADYSNIDKVFQPDQHQSSILKGLEFPVTWVFHSAIKFGESRFTFAHDIDVITFSYS
jgi:rRNA processing/ribosome biogenesis